MKILFFIDGLRKGGKERRLLELLKAIEQERIDYRVVVIHPEIEYDISQEMKSKIFYIKKKRKKDLSPFYEFFKICKSFNPDIIHTWSSMVTFYSLLAVIFQRRYLINSQITDAPPKFKKWSIFGITCKVNFFFSGLIVANSFAGLKAYEAPAKKSRVIYNGVDLSRFYITETKEEIKKKFGISTKYCIVMVASFSDNKDYRTFINVAYELQKVRKDLTFLSVGSGVNFESCKKYADELRLYNLFFLGQIDDVESLLKACDIGLLFSPNGEGLSNSIIEYLAMGLPAIANNTGGNSEIIKDGVNGFLIEDDLIINTCKKIIGLLNNNELRLRLEINARLTIENVFTLENMSKEFFKTYNYLLKN